MSFVKTIINFIIDLYSQRSLIFDLSKRDLKVRFAGSNLGIFWAFVQPVITILVLWFVVELGFKAQPSGGIPFILWLITGMLPFNFFSDGLTQATGSIIDNSFLVKKIVFRISLLPIIKILSSLFIHLFFIVFLFLIFALYGYYPSLYSVQVVYYLFASIILLLSISWATSAVSVFFRDLTQLVQTGLQILFWGTPVFWSLDIMPVKFHWLLKLNPLFYIIQGYRDSFINEKWFWQDWQLTIYFWGFVLICALCGITVFGRLKPHFADVL